MANLPLVVKCQSLPPQQTVTTRGGEDCGGDGDYLVHFVLSPAPLMGSSLVSSGDTGLDRGDVITDAAWFIIV